MNDEDNELVTTKNESREVGVLRIELKVVVYYIYKILWDNLHCESGEESTLKKASKDSRLLSWVALFAKVFDNSFHFHIQSVFATSKKKEGFLMLGF